MKTILLCVLFSIAFVFAASPTAATSCITPLPEKGYWGDVCPDHLTGAVTNRPCFRDERWANCYNYSIVLGCPKTKLTAKFTTHIAVQKFLPQKGNVGYFKVELENPFYTPAGMLAGQVLELGVTLGFDTCYNYCKQKINTMKLCPNSPGACETFSNWNLTRFYEYGSQAMGRCATPTPNLDTLNNCTWAVNMALQKKVDTMKCLDVGAAYGNGFEKIAISFFVVIIAILFLLSLIHI
eukprot:TRINITY_DN5565_c0_g1_i1.p1 TRINITY_DN5565_c0_g1~~TRINITY_DN5565_c0_g1_i1.p1  ORF type:complete len:257 (+),score=47.99 TRINITY_DN5565_c0_g1_i1:59-772(+)